MSVPAADPTPRPPVLLDDRGIVTVTGPDAAAFLHNLVSANIELLGEGSATYAALLSPQGRVLFDFFVIRSGETYWIDVASTQVATLAKRLAIYKLRSNVTISDRSADFAVISCPDSAALSAIPDAIGYADPRLAALGFRALVPAVPVFPADPAERLAYDRLRIALGVPEQGRDFLSGDILPHDINFDNLNAIDFRKGCYVGQEIVSRMKHRGTARKRLVHVRSFTDSSPALPAMASDILAGTRSIGTMGSSIGQTGLAIVRLDWAKDAIDRGIPITSGDIPLAIDLPAYATFSFPVATTEG